MNKYKVINITLLTLVIFIGLETSLNLFGRIALINEDFNKARLFLSLIREKELLGLVYYKQDQFEKAYNYYKQRKDWRGMGWAYYGMRKYEEAQDYFKRVNDNAGLGQVKLAQKNYSEAKKIFEETKEYSGMGLTHLADNNYYDAKESFLEGGDNFGLGITYFAKGDYEAAKNVFSQSKNKTVQGLRHLMEHDYNKAQTAFEAMNDNNLLGGYYKYCGDYDKAYEFFVKANNKKAAQIQLEKNEFINALELFNKNDDKNGLGDFYFYLGDYEKANEYYNMSKNYIKAFLSLSLSNNTQQARNYAKKVLTETDNPDLRMLLAESYRIAEEYKICENEIEKIKNNQKMVPQALLLQSRLNFSRGLLKPIQSDLQKAVDSAGSGLLSSEILKAANILGYRVAAPQKEIVKVITRSSPFKLLKIFIGGFILLMLTWVVSWIIHMKKKEQSELKGLEIGRRTHLSKTHKAIYSGKTAMNADTVRKLQPKTVVEKKEPEKEMAPEIERVEPIVPEDVKVKEAPESEHIQSKLERSGVQILQIALKKLNIISSALELLEVAGEEEGKLTVYGIYLAARSKGAQVQGIKVDFDYINENKNAINLVFFHDESFALLDNILESEIELIYGLNNVKKITLDQFKELWNGYIITISK